MKAHTQALLAACVLAGAVSAQSSGRWGTIYVRGKVVMEDGSPPGKSVGIWRQCSDYPYPDLVSTADKNGAYTWSMPVDTVSSRTCTLHAVLDAYESSNLDITEINSFSDPNLAALVLAPKGTNSEIEIFTADLRVPLGTASAWNRAAGAVRAGNWAEAERQLRAVLKTAPKFAQGWNALGLACERLRKSEEARDAYQRAIELDPKLLGGYVSLARMTLELRDWEGSAKAAAGLIKADTRQHFPEAYLDQAIARSHLQDLDGAEASAREAIRLDKRMQLPRAEYVLGVILEAKRDYTVAGEHMSKYLEREPRAADAEAVRAQIASLGKADFESASGNAPDLELEAAEVVPAGAGEAWVPGGMKALAAAAHVEGPVSYQSFFADYCRAIAREVSSTGTSQGIPGYIDTLRAYMASVSDLLPLGERRGDSTRITLSLVAEAQRKQAERILKLLGWKLVEKNSSYKVEPGDQPADGLRQRIPALFGFDEIDMQEALEAGRSFAFEIPSENARLVGGEAWNGILKDLPVLPGGIAATFTTNLRVTKMYSGLGAMGQDTAGAVLAAADLRTLATRYDEVLSRYSEAFTLVKNVVAVPGGAPAEEAWKKLTGASPHNPPAFFRALLEKDQGRLAAFYYAVWRSDEAHRQFFMKTAARAAQFYAWYRDSEEFRFGITRQMAGWRTDLFRDLPLDDRGNVLFPGGRVAWTASSSASDEAVLVGLKSLEGLVPISQLERHRKVPLDQASAVLLAQYYAEWRPLFPYFEDLPALGRTEFEALAAFAGAIGKSPPATQNLVLGEWYSLIELMARGVKAGSINAVASAQAFRRVCDGLASTDHSARALEALREIAGGGPDVNEAVPAGLLRLSGARRSAYDRVLELQNVPRLDAASSAKDPANTATALSGFVYAASLDPDALLITEDSHVLSRHQFFAAENPAKRAVFSPAALMGRNQAPGSYIRGGFTNFDQIAHGLARAGGTVERSGAQSVSVSRPDSAAAVSTAATSAPEAAAEAVFRADGRLVEVWATVTDSRGRYMDNLSADQFTILERQQMQPVVAFESRVTPVSVALLLDTTGSMQAALPALKNAAIKLMSDLRAGDSVAVYSFNSSVTELQPFTTDISAAKRAVLRTQALGETALYDALARVSRDLAGRPGKKVIVVFTDGNDNSSTLTTDTAILRAKATGVPVYTIAQGEALLYPAFVKQLAEVSKATGGESFVIHEPNEIGVVFEKVSEELTHGYLLTFAPPPAQDRSFHAIELMLQTKGLKPRFREGYYPQ